MSNKKKLDLIRSLQPGDVVITGNHIGSIRYLGPLDGLGSNQTLNTDKTKIFELFAGIELTEPNGHMDGTMLINGKKITYFTTTYGNNIKKKINKKRNNNSSETESKYDEHPATDENHGKYGILIPAIAIQKKIDSFALLKKITILFDQYKSIKKQLNFYKTQQRPNEQPTLHNEQSLIDIKTNSDLISPTTGYHTRPNNPISQPSITCNNYPTTAKIAGFNDDHHSNSHRYKKWSTAPLFNGYNSAANNGNDSTQNADNRKMPLRKINSEPYPYSSQLAFVANANNASSNDINDGYLMHRHSNTVHHPHNNNLKLFVPNSNVTTPHISDVSNMDDELNNSDFPSIEDQPKLDKHSKSYPNNLNKQQLSTSLPAPMRTLNRVHSYHTNNNNYNNNMQSRTRGSSFQSYSSQIASKRTPEPPSPNVLNPNDTLKISSTANTVSQSPHVAPISPAISHTTVVINNEDTPRPLEEADNAKLETQTQQKLCELPDTKTAEAPKTISVNVKIAGNELPKVPTILSPENSQKSDQTMNTQRSRAGTGHHPSSSMYTHAPLNHWNDSNRYVKMTSVGGSADKNRDLSSLAISVSSPGHTRPKSAMNFNTRESMNINNRIQHVANQDSVQLKQLLADLKKNKLNQINIAQEIEIIDNEISIGNINDLMNTDTMRQLTDNSSESSTDTGTNDDDLPRLIDNNTTAATVHSTADVLENLVTHSIASSPEEKLAEVENNEDEKQLLPPTDAMSDIATPIPKEAGANIMEDAFKFCDEIVNDTNTENNDVENVDKRLSLTVQSLRKHNKRRASREQLTFDDNIKEVNIINNIGNLKRKNYVINIHHHQQTLSEPMLPKFALMMHTFDSSEEEKSASSDGEDTHSIGMENNLEDSVHTHDVTEDDVQLIQIPQQNHTDSNQIKANQNENRLCSPTFTADSISRRSSVNVTNGVWDCSNITLYNLTNGVGDDNETPKQQYIRRMTGPGNTSSTPTYSSYKTRHEYLRDMTYFNTVHRAQQIDQQFKKLKKGKIESKKEQNKLVSDGIEAADAAVQREKKRSNSISSLNIIQETFDDYEEINGDKEEEVNNTKEEEDDIDDIQDINIGVGHRQQLSCDTRAAIEGGIEPYKPSQHIIPQSAMV